MSKPQGKFDFSVHPPLWVYLCTVWYTIFFIHVRLVFLNPNNFPTFLQRHLFSDDVLRLLAQGHENLSLT